MASAYISPKLIVRQVQGKGHGQFACLPIAAGDLMVVWGGDVYTSADFAQLPQAARLLSVQVDDDHYLVSTTHGDGDKINHSCAPNAGMRGQISVVAMRDIAVGEEICYDYAMTDGSDYDEFECACGAPSCRHRVTGQDWRLAELQVRYAGFFSPYLQRRIDAAVKQR
jgi:uncharacterized protein